MVTPPVVLTDIQVDSPRSSYRTLLPQRDDNERSLKDEDDDQVQLNTSFIRSWPFQTPTECIDCQLMVFLALESIERDEHVVETSWKKAILIDYNPIDNWRCSLSNLLGLFGLVESKNAVLSDG